MEVTDEAVGGHRRGRSNRNVNQPSVAAMTADNDDMELAEIVEEYGGGQPEEKKQVEDDVGGPHNITADPEEDPDMKEKKKEETGKIYFQFVGIVQ